VCPRDSAERLVGRLAELDLLRDSVHRAKDGHGCVVLIHGEPGMGKTRLAEEAADYAASVGCAAAWGRCSGDAGAPPFWPWRQLVQQVSDATGLLPASTRGLGLMDGIAPGADSPARAIEPPISGGEAGEHIQFRLFDAVGRFLRHAARQKPLLLILEDLHWAEESSLRLFQHVAGEARESPLMFLGTYRNEERNKALKEAAASLARLRRYACLQVRGLNEPESRELLEAACGSAVPAEMAEAAHRLTDGNPLYLRQVSFSLPRAAPPPGAPVGIAASFNELVQERLALVGEGSRALVEAAAILGDEPTDEALAEVAGGMDVRDAGSPLREACAAHLIEEVPGSAGRYRFLHALIREAVYAGLHPRGRVELHACAARLLERRSAQEEAAHAAELLRHFQAARPLLGAEPVVRYALLAGERALRDHAYPEAVGCFQSGLDAREGAAVDDAAAALLFGMARTRALFSMGHE
jgi:predicted ATPase